MLTGKHDLGYVKDKRVVLLQSGGLDSCYLACLFNRYGFEVDHVYIDYGQNARVQEKASAERIVEAYGGTLHCITLDMPWLKEATLLNGHDVGVYEVGETLGAVQAGTYVPMRNLIFLGIASSLAEAKKIKYISAGLDGSQDFFGRPLGGTTDKHPNFVKELEKALTEGSAMKHVDNNKFELIVPIIGNHKWQTISAGKFIGCDFSLSWTCYNSTEEPCGKCCSCLDRLENFEYLGLKDPAFKNNK